MSWSFYSATEIAARKFWHCSDIDDAHLDNPELYSGINQRYRCITKQLQPSFPFPLGKQYSDTILVSTCYVLYAVVTSRLCELTFTRNRYIKAIKYSNVGLFELPKASLNLQR